MMRWWSRQTFGVGGRVEIKGNIVMYALRGTWGGLRKKGGETFAKLKKELEGKWELMWMTAISIILIKKKKSERSVDAIEAQGQKINMNNYFFIYRFNCLSSVVKWKLMSMIFFPKCYVLSLKLPFTRPISLP